MKKKTTPCCPLLFFFLILFSSNSLLLGFGFRNCRPPFLPQPVRATCSLAFTRNLFPFSTAWSDFFAMNATMLLRFKHDIMFLCCLHAVPKPLEAFGIQLIAESSANVGIQGSDAKGPSSF